ncbi:hypothetical protein [Streptomyces sp. CMB-StM0423]|uniref:hypothetical protein n=1 Tax=Streptomyces sp. CMB-StM0423 TaxID=2059884 RepID=UPI000C7088D9|nr:hypothetical protein [Streptomyces sp. CMB-StM0423]AUH40535.1 hypothetical protein CXR04_09980 [Streptomyces sp. CMB-StM0423]
MPRPTGYAERLTDDITHRIALLADHLSQLPPDQAAQVIARTLDSAPETGLLGAVTHLMAVSSVFAKNQTARGTLPPEVWLALGRAANTLDDIARDLDEHLDVLRHVGNRPAEPEAAPPAPAPPVDRRRR